MKSLQALLPLLSLPYCLSLLPYYIQTDLGDHRFFQFSSGAGGQYRRETILDNGTVVGSYSWEDTLGHTRLYVYKADTDGYRVVAVSGVNIQDEGGQHEEEEEDNNITRRSKKIKYDPREGANIVIPVTKSPQGRSLMKKVLVKKKKGLRREERAPVLVRRLGMAVEVIPYSEELVTRTSDVWGTGSEVREPTKENVLVNEPVKGIIRKRRLLELPGELPDNVVEEAALPTSRLLGRIKVERKESGMRIDGGEKQ